MTGVFDPLLFVVIVAFAVLSGAVVGLLPALRINSRLPLEDLRRV
jgi:ABC-type antimicrobial peptide transport system permease subunit